MSEIEGEFFSISSRSPRLSVKKFSSRLDVRDWIEEILILVSKFKKWLSLTSGLYLVLPNILQRYFLKIKVLLCWFYNVLSIKCFSNSYIQGHESSRAIWWNGLDGSQCGAIFKAPLKSESGKVDNFTFTFISIAKRCSYSRPTQWSNPIPTHPTFSSEACMPWYMKDRKSFKNSDNAMKQELSFQKGLLHKNTKTKTKTKTKTNTKTKQKQCIYF